MRVLLFLLSAFPTFALAALPVLSTDTLALGENSLAISVGQSHDSTDLLLTHAGISYPGSGKNDATDFSGSWRYSPGQDMEVGLTVGHLSSDMEETIHGVNLVETRTRIEGWTDLSWYTQWRFGNREQTAWSVAVSGMIPTASDGRAVPETVVNGVVKPPAAHDGSPGHGYSEYSVAGLLSRRIGNRDALEGSASWSTDDKGPTSDSYGVGGSYVHFLGTGNNRATLGIQEFFYGADKNGVAQTPGHKATLFSAGLSLRPKNDIELSAYATYLRFDDYATLYPMTGDTFAINSQSLVGLGVGIRVLMP